MGSDTDKFDALGASMSPSVDADTASAKHDSPAVDTGTATPADESNERSGAAAPTTKAHDSSEPTQPRRKVAAEIESEPENET